jgi:hypothetical protein
MHLPLLSLAILSLSTLATTNPLPSQSTPLIVAVTQAGYQLAYILDTKNFTALSTILTPDVTFDETELRVGGGKTKGFAQTVALMKLGLAGAKTQHQITNVLLLEEISAKKARVNS